MSLRILLVIFMAIFLFGCATARKTEDLRVRDLQNHTRYLETELEKKDEEISFLEEALEELRGTSQKKKITSRPTSKKIQIALRNAGFYKGPIDGRIGPKTKKATREFQKANGLASDGVVGKKTWRKLSKYLD